MEAVILAGGRGKRLGNITTWIPKPLVKVGQKALIEHQINLLKRYKITKIWVLSAYRSNQIINCLGDGKKWKVKITHLVEDKPLGSGGALKQLEGKIKGDFFLFSGDIFLNMDLEKYAEYHKRCTGSVATIVVHPNDHPYDSDLVEVDENFQVLSFLIRKGKIHSKNIIFRNLANAGIFILSPKIFKHIKPGEKKDLEKDIFPLVLTRSEKIYAYNSPEYIKDAGTPERLKSVRADFKSGRTRRLSLSNKRKAIFLDRDGTICDYDGRARPLELNLFPYTAKAIKKLNRSDYLVIVITNQPAVAKGFITRDKLEMIHKKMETKLGWDGAKIDALFYCPHHPQGGFLGEDPKLKIYCSCRKPKIGMIKRAAKQFNIDLNSSYLIGDSTVDAECAKRAGLKFIAVETGYGLSDGRYDVPKDVVVSRNLYRAVSMLF